MSTCATEGTPSTFWTQSELAPKPIHMNITRPLSTTTVSHSIQQLNAVTFQWQYFIFLGLLLLTQALYIAILKCSLYCKCIGLLQLYTGNLVNTANNGGK